mmetsp:Transcript_29593/g.95602  ORF Transcript_29593/g.95602 Transcript_29593/m.95602 type:complete len:314 (+) Transcript_29593:140-1081(+)|eukprot:scaffold10759_cov149-Isochrysis_galbana.AAC.2
MACACRSLQRALALPPERTAHQGDVALSLSTSDPPATIQLILLNLLAFTAPSTRVVLHIGCGSVATAADKQRLGQLPRVILNPECLEVHRNDGTILHAHLLNAALLASVPPRLLMLASADMRWLAAGAEVAALSRTVSVSEAPWMDLDLAYKAVHPRHREKFFNDDLQIAMGAGNRLVVQKHEGSFYPWEIVRDFITAMCKTGSLTRFAQRPSVFARPTLQLAPEETLLQSFAAAKLNVSLQKAMSILDVDERLHRGVFCGFDLRLRGGSWHCTRMASGSNCVGSTVFARKVEGENGHAATEALFTQGLQRPT